MTSRQETASSRRDFLARAAASSFFVVSPRFLGTDQGGAASHPAPAKPPAGPIRGSGSFAAFLDAASRAKKPAILIRIPADSERRAAFLHALGRALGDEIAALTPAAAEIFADTILACGSSEAIHWLVPGAPPEETLMLLDERGRRLDGLAMPEGALGDARALVAGLRKLAHGADDSRLRARAEAALASPTPSARRVLARLMEGEAMEGDAPSDAIDALLPVLVLRKPTAEPAVAFAIDSAIRAHFLQSFEEHFPGPLLPYGMELVSPSHAPCSGRLRGRLHRGMSTCGMAGVRGPAVRRFIDLVAK